MGRAIRSGAVVAARAAGRATAAAVGSVAHHAAVVRAAGRGVVAAAREEAPKAAVDAEGGAD